MPFMQKLKKSNTLLDVSMICKFEILAKGNDDIIGKEWCSVGSGFDVKKCTVQKSNYASHTAAFNQVQ